MHRHWLTRGIAFTGLTALLGCAAPAPRARQRAPTLADRVRQTYRARWTQARVQGLGQTERALQRAYLQTLKAAASRHERPGQKELHAKLKARERKAWGRLREHYRHHLPQDLKAGRFRALRLRARGLGVFARVHLDEVMADHVAGGGAPARYGRAPLPFKPFVYPVSNIPRSLKTPLQTLLSDDERFERFAANLGHALFTLRAGTPRVDTAFVEAFTARWHALLLQEDRRLTRPPLRPSKRALGRARRAADEAEGHRDRALDAALDSVLAREGAAPRGAPEGK